MMDERRPATNEHFHSERCGDCARKRDRGEQSKWLPAKAEMAEKAYEKRSSMQAGFQNFLNTSDQWEEKSTTRNWCLL